MKKKILKELKDRLGNTSLSERTLEEFASNCESRIDPSAGIDDSVINELVSTLRIMEGQLRHDVSEIIKKERSKESQLVNEPIPVQEDLNAKFRKEAIEVMNRIVDENKQLKERITGIESEYKTAKRKSLVEQALKAQGATDEYVLSATLRNFVDDQSLSDEDLIKRNISIYDDEYTACRGAGTIPRPSNANTEAAANKSLKAFKESLEQEGAL